MRSRQFGESSKFNLPDEKEENNLLLAMHMSYLETIRETVNFRFYIRKVIGGIAFAIYLLFFFRSPEM